jgi:hypothetical protein
MRILTSCFLIAALGSSGCEYKEWKYQREIVRAECDYAMDCYSGAVLTFYGWNTVEDCVVDRGPEVAAATAACVYDDKAAKDCVKALDQLACQDGGDPTFPSACDQVYADCSVDTSISTTVPTDTGA